MANDRSVQQWTKPEAGLIQDYTFFDGIYIRTDSICNPSRDRVLPIMPEEQVFTCRQMRGRLDQLREQWRQRGEPGKVLDIGTGSGILAIYADKVLNRDGELHASIRGLDVSVRALQRAEANVETNQCRGVEIDKKGMRYSPESVARGSLDLALMNPPFNPTAPTFDELVAHHGATTPKAELSLSVFKEWLPIVKDHLRPGGWIIGCQLSPVDGQGRILAVELLREALGPRSFVHYCRMMPGEDPDTNTFLHAQYEDHLESATADDSASGTEQVDRRRESREEMLRGWIEEKHGQFPKLTLVYYEATNEAEEGGDSPFPSPYQEAHGVTWEKRARWHRMVVNNTQGYPEELPRQSLASTLPVLYHRQPKYDQLGEYWEKRDAGGAARVEAEEMKTRLAEASILNDLTRYLRDSQLFDKFDFVVIDATPILPGEKQDLRLHQECGIWWTPREDASPAKWGSLLRHFQKTIYGMQQSRLAPFFHPCFVYPDEVTGWSRGWVSRMCGAAPSPNPHDSGREVSTDHGGRDFDAWARSNEYIEKHFTRITLPKEIAEQDDVFLVCPTESRYIYSSQRLVRLVQKQNGGSIPRASLEVNWHDFLKSFHERMRDAGDLSPEDDYRACHWAMHKRYHAGAVEYRGENAFSILVGVPLSYAGTTVPDLGTLNEKTRLPRPFYGGVWFWVGGKGEKGDEFPISYDAALKDLVHFTLHLLEMTYKELLVEANKLLGDANRRLSFAHHGYPMISSIWSALQSQVPFDQLNPTTWATLISLKVKMGMSQKGAEYDLRQRFFDQGVPNVIETYGTVAAAWALEKAFSRASRRLQQHTTKLRRDYQKLAPAHLREWLLTPVTVPDGAASRVDKEAFGTLYIFSLGQALFHTYDHLLHTLAPLDYYSPNTNLTPEIGAQQKVTVSIDPMPSSISVTIANPGDPPTTADPSADAQEIAELADYLGGSTRSGPGWDSVLHRWVTSFTMRLAEGN